MFVAKRGIGMPVRPGIAELPGNIPSLKPTNMALKINGYNGWKMENQMPTSSPLRSMYDMVTYIHASLLKNPTIHVGEYTIVM